MKPDFNVYFLTLPENLDPDAYINEKGKESFLKFTDSKMAIQNFIWDSYSKEVVITPINFFMSLGPLACA